MCAFLSEFNQFYCWVVNWGNVQISFLFLLLRKLDDTYIQPPIFLLPVLSWSLAPQQKFHNGKLPSTLTLRPSGRLFCCLMLDAVGKNETRKEKCCENVHKNLFKMGPKIISFNTRRRNYCNFNIIFWNLFSMKRNFFVLAQQNIPTLLIFIDFVQRFAKLWKFRLFLEDFFSVL